MQKQQHDYTPILQNLIDGFSSLKNCLSYIGPALTNIRRTQDDYGIKIIYSKTDGTIKTVKWLPPRTNDERIFRIANIDKSHELLENCQTEIIEEGNILPELVETIHKAVQQLHQALNDLPDNVHTYLSKVHRRSWHLLVRQECLDLICYWPKHPSDPQRDCRIYTPDRLRVPNRVDELLEYTTKVDPTPFWQKLSQKLDSYINDVLSIRREFNAGSSDPKGSSRSKGKRKHRFTKEENDELEKNLKKFLIYNPKATRDKCAKQLDISVGKVSALNAWKNRKYGKNNFQANNGESTLPIPKNMQRVGIDIAVEEKAASPQQELKRLEQEQKRDAKIDGIDLDSG